MPDPVEHKKVHQPFDDEAFSLSVSRALSLSLSLSLFYKLSSNNTIKEILQY
jgi:hypothetical protein